MPLLHYAIIKQILLSLLQLDINLKHHSKTLHLQNHEFYNYYAKDITNKSVFMILITKDQISLPMNN